MRTIIFKRSDNEESREIAIRALKRKEVKELKKLGYGYIGMTPIPDTLDEAIDAGLEKVLTDGDLDFLGDCDNLEFRRCWGEMLKETYGDKKEEKNSGNTTDGGMTESGSGTAKAVVDTKPVSNA